jgi:UDP-glucose-4-epimerase GalE
MKVLVAGGAGYIGSHTVLALQQAGHEPIIYDNGGRGHKVVGELLDVPCVWGELDDAALLTRTLRENDIELVMHFAAYAYVGESVHEPLMYYHNNVATTVNVLQCMREAGVKKFVFSSTCATYGDPDTVPITESEPQTPVSPYGHSKLMVERVLQDYAASDPDFKYAALRYFNACGCDPDGKLGEDHDPETHLIPVIFQALLGQREALTVFGTDYPTDDGTCVRDYIHVADLADAHIKAAAALDEHREIKANLGTGRGFSVKEIIKAAEAVTGRKVPVTYGDRRAGDAIALFADPSHAKNTFGWEAEYKDPADIIRTAWAWHEKHPNGYGD